MGSCAPAQACEPHCQVEISHGFNQRALGRSISHLSIPASPGRGREPQREELQCSQFHRWLSTPAETALPHQPCQDSCFPFHPVQLQGKLGNKQHLPWQEKDSVLHLTPHSPPFSLFHSKGYFFCLAAAKFLFLSSSPNSSMENESRS